MDWNKAKFDKSNALDFTEEANRRKKDAAAQWLKKEEKRAFEAKLRKPKKSDKPARGRPPMFSASNLAAGLIIYTDGACEPNPGKGGWAFVVYQDGKEIHSACGGDSATTNNVMELTGVIKALEWLNDNREIGSARILSDSQYVVRGCNEWRQGWKRKGWMRGKVNALESIKNMEHWKRLDSLLDADGSKIEWVKGHVGIVGNERADQLSNVGRSAAINARGAR